MLEHCQLHSTNNFSLYTGRGGLIYALLELHSVTNNPQFIESSLELMDTVDQDYLISPYTTDYLYDGRSGTLLVLLSGRFGSLVLGIMALLEANKGNEYRYPVAIRLVK